MAFVITGQGSGSTDARGIAVGGPASDIYVTGQLGGVVDFDPGPGTVALSADGHDDLYVARYDDLGNLIWARDADPFAGNVSGKHVAADGSGNVYVTGEFSGTIDMDPGPGTVLLTTSATIDHLLAKYDASGDLLWAYRLDTSSNAFAAVNPSVAADASGNFYLGGEFLGTVDIDPGSGITTLAARGLSNHFVAKFGPTGTLQWAVTSDDSDDQEAVKAVAVDGSGNVVVAGTFSGSVDFEPGVGTMDLWSSGVRDIFVAKYDAAGNIVWAVGTGNTTGDEDANAVAVDGAGNVIVAGVFDGTVDFDPGPGTVLGIASSPDYNHFVAKYDAGGALQWAVTGAGSYAAGLAADGTGNIYVGGWFTGTVDFDPGPGTTALVSSGLDHFVARLDPQGNLDWVRHAAASTGNEQTTAVAVDGDGRPYAAGLFDGQADFGTGPREGAKHFVIGYTASGSLRSPTIDRITDDTDEAGDFVTRDRTLTLFGTAEPFAHLDMTRDDVLVGTATAGADGSWSWKDPATLALGSHSWRAIDGDQAGYALAYVVSPSGTAATSGADYLAGTSGSNSIDGKDGDDLLFGLGGNDTLKGGNGEDGLFGGAGDDAVWGGAGRDWFRGGDGRDTLYGEAGDDEIRGGTGDDSIEGGTGDDRLVGEAGADTLRGGDGADHVQGDAGADRLYGEGGSDRIDLGFADGARDTVFGTVAHLSGDTITSFEWGKGGDAIAVTGLASSYGKYLDSLTVTDGVLSLSKVGGGALLLQGLEGIHYTDTVLGSDGSILMYVV